MSDDHEDYEVGYGKPPKHSRFKPGQSGNRQGRPKLYESTMSVLSEPVPMMVQGKKVKVSSIEAGIRKTAQNALEGRMQSIKRFVKLCDEFHLINGFDDFNPWGTVHVPQNMPTDMTLDELAREQHLERKKVLPKREYSEKETIIRKVALERHYVPELQRKHTILELILLTLKKKALEDRNDIAPALFLEIETRRLPSLNAPVGKYLLVPGFDFDVQSLFVVEDVDPETDTLGWANIKKRVWGACAWTILHDDQTRRDGGWVPITINRLGSKSHRCHIR